jgi:GalNAc-alpha-(1->4)-GalNAc-alpha-(1->3)-diNAcBac-PP-undecaprenol alpha-1,4-N-acetyl-D-galactosaminyltransferase
MGRNKKILFILDSLGYGGLEKMITWVANQISLFGCDVNFCVFYKPGHFFYDLDLNINKIKLNIIFDENLYKRYFRLLTTGFYKLFFCFKTGRYDYVVSFSQSSLNLLVPLKYIFRYKLIISERGDPYTPASFTFNFKRKLYRFSDVLVFQTIGAKNYFPKIIQNKSKVIPNPISIPTRAWDIQNTSNSICMFSRINISHKRHDVLIEAFQIFKNRYSGYRLFLYGDGNDLKKIESIIKENKLEESVFLPGKSVDVINDLLQHKIFAFSSDWEGMPNALLEAMSVGMPVISTDWSPKGGVSTMINNLENGIVVPRRDPEALAEALCLLASDTALMVRMGANARESMKKFSPEKIAALWKEIFETL